MASSFEDAYAVTYDTEADTSTATCSAWRVRNAPEDAIEFKYGTAYTVRTGYKIYESATTWFPTSVGAGEPVEMTFMMDGATFLVKSAASILTTAYLLN